MITFSKLGQHGRLANQLFQIAYLYALATKHNTEFVIPDWPYAKYFERKFPTGTPQPDVLLKEPAYKYTPNLFDEHTNILKTYKVDILGYFQHKEYWGTLDIKSLFKFDELFEAGTYAKYAYLLEKPTVAVGVRRTDYVTKGQYHNLSPAYYLNALKDVPKDTNIIFITDDLDWCKFHFGCFPNAHFPTFESDIEQFCFGTFVDRWVIANSTFHWWSAYLSNVTGVVQPTRLFAGDLLRREGDYNFFSDEWERQEDGPVELPDVTFTIPVKYDHPDRKRNLELTICLLQKAFNTNIVVGEQGGKEFKYVEKFGVKYRNFDLPNFHRTKMLNIMALEATTSVVANWDADVMVAPAQIYQAVAALTDPLNPCDVAYPYDNLFFRIPKVYHKRIHSHYDLYDFTDLPVKRQDKKSVGGALLYRRDSFLEAGGENETFVSYGPEDQERFCRFEKLRLDIRRIPGNLYHFDHHVGVDSSTTNPFYAAGKAEFEFVKGLSFGELRGYVGSWKDERGY